MFLPTTSCSGVENSTLSISLNSHLLNRGQWYTLQCKFSRMGSPDLVGQSVTIDPQVSFQDSRKRFNGNLDRSDMNGYILSVWGTCSTTGNSLQKCLRCQEQDKITTNRKRKRETEGGWTEMDQDNNSKLFQILDTGALKIAKDGTLELKFRVLCCVGAVRQFHRNHKDFNTGKDGDEEIHKGCEGISLGITLRKEALMEISKIFSEPIRVVGKVTKTKSPPPLIIHTEDSIKTSTGGGGTRGSEEEDEESDSPSLKNYLQTQPKAFGRFTIPKSKKTKTEISEPHKPLRNPEPIGSASQSLNLHYPKPVPTPFRSNGNNINQMSNTIIPNIATPPPIHQQQVHTEPVTPLQFSRKFGNPEISPIKKPLVQYHYDINRYHQSSKFEFILNTKEKDAEPSSLPPPPIAPPGPPQIETTVPKISSILEVGYPETGWILYQIYNALELPFDDWNSLRDLVQSYLSTYDMAFPLSYREIFEEDYFKFSVISIIPSESAEMLHVFNTLAIADFKLGTTKKRDRLYSLADELIAHLLQKINHSNSKFNNRELLLLADALTRSSGIQVEQCRFSKARYYLEQTYQLFETLIQRQPTVSQIPAYQFYIYLKHCIYPELNEIPHCIDWAKSRGYLELQVRLIGLSILIHCSPNLHIGSPAAPKKPISPISPVQYSLLYTLCDQLQAILSKLPDTDIKTSDNSSLLYSTAINSIRNWIKWDISGSIQSIKDCVNHMNINHKQEHIILDMASFVAVQLVGISIYYPQLFEDKNDHHHHPSSGSPQPFSNPIQRTEKLKDYAQNLLFSCSKCIWPWGKFIFDYNTTILKHFMEKSL